MITMAPLFLSPVGLKNNDLLFLSYRCFQLPGSVRKGRPGQRADDWLKPGPGQGLLKHPGGSGL